MIIGQIVGLIINFIAFIVIAEFLPGFKVKSRGTAGVMALVYGILNGLGFYLLMGMMVAGVLALLAIFPPLGFLAGVVAFPAAFFLTFLISLVALVVTDKIMDDFEMTSVGIAIVASILLGVINAIIRTVIPV